MRHILRRVERTLRVRGVGGTLQHAVVVAKRRIGLLPAEADPEPEAVDTEPDFDARFGVDTAGIIPQAELDVDAPTWVHGSAYVPISPIDFASVLGRFDLDVREATFVDLGCGKGRVLLMASALPFARIVGVEFSPTLAAIARDNLTRYTGPRAAQHVDVLTEDATRYTFPSGPLVVFMYHPFDGVVMQRVVAQLERSLAERRRRIVVLYYKAVHGDVWEASKAFAKAHETDAYVAYVGGSGAAAAFARPPRRISEESSA